VRNGQLIVATAIGVFASRGTDGGTYSPLGDDLPSVAVYQISLKPGDPDTLVAATFGRGVYTYKFANRSGGGGSNGGGCVDRVRPRTRFSKAALRAARRGGEGARKLRLGGSVTDRGCRGRKGKVKRVLISIARQSGRTCRNLKANGALAAPGSCHKFLYLSAHHKGNKWSFTTKRSMPRGRYRIRVKAIDTAGNREHLDKRTNTVRLTLR
jgi:hypothetical protein